MLKWFPWIGWSNVATTRELVSGDRMLVQELWFNWITAQKLNRLAIINDVKVGRLCDGEWFKQRLERSET